jgi:hypothetical protein
MRHTRRVVHPWLFAASDSSHPAVCREQFAYKFSAIAATALFCGLAVFATYNRFFYHASDYDTFPWVEFWSTIAMIGGGVVCPCSLT